MKKIIALLFVAAVSAACSGAPITQEMCDTLHGMARPAHCNT